MGVDGAVLVHGGMCTANSWDPVLPHLTMPVVAIDLPDIIRESSGSLVYDSVRGVRMQSIDADRQVERLAHRLLRRHGTQEPDTPEGAR